MTKKHFVALADCLRALRPPTRGDALALYKFSYWKDTVQALADFCRSQSPRFNRTRWLAYIDGECGPNGGAIKPKKENR